MTAPRGTQLAWPFALVGFVGGAFVGAIPHEAWVAYVVAIVTAIVAGSFGALVTRARRKSPPSPASVGAWNIFVGSLLAGAANGCLLVGGVALANAPAAFPIAVVVGIFVGAI